METPKPQPDGPPRQDEVGRGYFQIAQRDDGYVVRAKGGNETIMLSTSTQLYENEDDAYNVIDAVGEIFGIKRARALGRVEVKTVDERTIETKDPGGSTDNRP